MSESLIVQYLGFQATLLAREYTFKVREAGVEREFTLNIPNEAFLSHRVNYQDAPGVCSQRLQAELAAHANHPSETQFVITADELESYRSSHKEKPTRYTPPQPEVPLPG